MEPTKQIDDQAVMSSESQSSSQSSTSANRPDTGSGTQNHSRATSDASSQTRVGSTAGSTPVASKKNTPGNSRNSSAQTAHYGRVLKYNPLANWEFVPGPEQTTSKTEVEKILSTYDMNSDIYHHHNYDNQLSDDDLDILKDDPEEKKKTKNGETVSTKKVTKKDRWFVTTNSVSVSGSGTTSQGSVAGSDSSSKEKQTENKNETSIFINPPAELRSEEDRAERGEVPEADTQLPFKYRLGRRWRHMKEWAHKHKFQSYFVFTVLVKISVCALVIFPLGDRFGWFDEQQSPTVTVYEQVSKYTYPTLSAIRTALVDPDTPKAALTRKNINGESWDLVFSDEFNAEGRTFYKGMDQFWEAADIHYAATKDLEWYDPDAVFTKEGTLNLKMDVFHNHDLFYRSGMLQSWNKMCFSEGILEILAKMPGSAYTAGLWPGLWALGNLARPGYLASTDGVWPYSYNECDAGITPNQSSPDGLSYLPGQRLNKCTCKNEDHPNRGTGRGAPEVDLLEGAHSTNFATDVHFGVASQTLQIAPFDIWYVPDYEFVALHNITKSNINNFLGTPFQEMLSVQTTVNETWYESIVDANETTKKLNQTSYFQKYALEYISKDKDHMKNYACFFLGDEPSATIYGPALHPNGNIGWRDMPKEPMSIVLNLGLSTSWSAIQWLNFVFPMTFEIDYVRIYQPPDQKNGLTCDPPDYPTTEYIENHLNAYMNPNLTSWADAGYSMPLNKLTSDKC